MVAPAERNVKCTGAVFREPSGDADRPAEPALEARQGHPPVSHI